MTDSDFNALCSEYNSLKAEIAARVAKIKAGTRRFRFEMDMPPSDKAEVFARLDSIPSPERQAAYERELERRYQDHLAITFGAVRFENEA